jgi:ribosome-binding protein aMBF1 (putative translation factor)
MLGNNAQNISRLERGEVSPTLYWLKNLSEAFDVNLTQLIEEFESSV